MHTEYLVVFLVGDYLDEAFVIPKNRRLAVADERKLPCLHFVTGVARLLFCQANGADLWLAERAIRASVAVERLHGFPRHAPDGDDSLHRRSMRELRLARDDVTNGVKMRLGCLHKRRSVNEAALEFSLRFFDAHILRHRAAANGNENFFGCNGLRFAGFVFERDARAIRIFFHRLDSRFELKANAFLTKSLAQLGRNFLVFQRYKSRQHFKDRHIASKALINRSEFDSHRARSHYDQRFRYCGHVEHAAIVHNHFVVDFNAGQRPRIRAGREHNVRRFNFGLLAILFDGNAPGSDNASPALHRLHLIFLEQKFDTLGVLVNDLRLALDHRRPIHFHVLDFEAKFRRALEVVVNLRVVQQDFRGNAADVQTRSAQERIFLDAHGLQAPLPGANRRHVAARPASYDG